MHRLHTNYKVTTDVTSLNSIVYFQSLFFYRDRIDLGEITQHNIKQLKLLNQVILPVTYNDKFYKDVLDVGDLAKLGNV